MAASTTHLHVVRTNKLVIFYSREGNTKKIASRIAEHVKADVLENQELTLHGGLSFFKLCYRARVKAFTPITTSNKVELANYDTVFIGSPVHANHLSSPCRTWLHDNKAELLSTPRVYHFFTTTWGTGASDLFADMTELLGVIPISTLAVLSRNIDSWLPEAAINFFDKEPYFNALEQSQEEKEKETEIQEEAEEIVSTPPGSPKTATQGTIEDKYLVFYDDQLGHGTFSVVYKGQNKITGEMVAVKVMKKNDFKPETVKQQQREMSILRKLSHKNIVGLRDIYDTGMELQLVLDYVPGGELWAAIVDRGIFTEKHAQKIMYQLLSAVKYMHKNGIIHRDLKPENLLCSNSDAKEIKITDFGLAKDLLTEECARTPCGTPSYVAPEVLIGCDYDCKCDIWSAGVILYVLLTGFLPFDGETMNETIERISAGTVFFPANLFDGVSKEARHLISVMLTTNPDLRPSAAECLTHPWFKLAVPSTPVLTRHHFSHHKSSFYPYYQASSTTNSEVLDPVKTEN